MIQAQVRPAKLRLTHNPESLSLPIWLKKVTI
jgi:hypothetical protein